MKIKLELSARVYNCKKEATLPVLLTKIAYLPAIPTVGSSINLSCRKFHHIANVAFVDWGRDWNLGAQDGEMDITVRLVMIQDMSECDLAEFVNYAGWGKKLC
ncbi:hypothetical protein UFOVP276_234 [uncultured Caudovirales phage]|uniref:Uncharacterized protein n=1 Tax=uncultured Caudovirales phage TaxID=2100421 RepID=A0A6J5LIP8_9CAUD|nr:hypothetical protein UFOVP127_128 [uncultured Caudovirales phage]CAB4135278.1 hypothetical protein UFOVP276_234 [uncultured Caudovirales phage]